MYKIILMGPQGSGKGTQAELLSDRISIPAFGMGQLLRDEIAAGTEIGIEVDNIIKAGNLVSDKMAAKVLKKRLERPDTKNGYILDGYPRNIEQYNEFTFDKPTHVILIDIPRDETIKRLSGRLTCSACGKVGSISGGKNIRDSCECGGELYQRSDDKEEAIKRRLEIFINDTKPVIEEYRKQNILYEVNGTGSIQEIHERIVNKLE